MINLEAWERVRQLESEAAVKESKGEDATKLRERAMHLRLQHNLIEQSLIPFGEDE